MSINCPNKSLKEWKMLTKQTGEKLANLAFIANGYQIPDVRPITEIKKAIGFKSKTENFASIASKIKKYNRKHGTAHSFTIDPVYGNTFELEFFANYLPVNLEKQRRRSESRGEVFQIESIHNEAFDTIYTPSLSEQEAGYFNEEGDFLPLADRTDDMVPSAGTTLANTEKVRVEKIEAEAIKERHIAKEAANNEDIEGVKASRRRLEALREELNNPVKGAYQRKLLSEKIKSVKDVLTYAEMQLKETDKLLFATTAISFEDLQYAQRIVDLWIKAADFTGDENKHIFLDKYEFNTPEIQEEFNKFRVIAEKQQGKITKMQKIYFADFVRAHTSGELTNDQIFGAMKDLGKISSMTLAVRRTDDPMIQAIFSAVEAANMNAQQEADVEWKKLDKANKAFLKASGNNYNILKQLTVNGKETGRMVGRFTDEFYKTRRALADKAFNLKDNLGREIKDKAAVDNYYNWVKKNTITFDTRQLFPDIPLDDDTMPGEFLYPNITHDKNGNPLFDEAKRDAHIAELKEHLGEKGFEFYMARQKEKYTSFRLDRNVKYSQIQSDLSDHTQEERDAFFKEWLKEHSPFLNMDMLDNPKMRQRADRTYYKTEGLNKFAVQVPKRIDNGKETGWYDKNYQKIENNPALFEYHQMVIGMLNKMRYLLPESKAKHLGVGVIPYIEKNIMEMFSDKGLKMGISPFFDKMKQLQSTRDISTKVTNDVNPRTGKIEKNISTSMVQDTEAKISSLVRAAKIKHKQETGKPATNAESRAFAEAAREQMSKQQSWDINRIMKAYILEALAYKHKSAIEPQIKAAEALLAGREELTVNKTGETMTKDSEESSEKGKLQNLKNAFEYFLDEVYYGIGGRKIQGVSKKKSYSKSEQKAKTELEALLEKAEDEEEKKFIKSQLDKLGSHKTLSDAGDILLKLQTLKGLGWNIFSGFSNIGFGVISNLIEMSDGRIYTPAQMRDAYILTTNSIGRNLSFNAFEGVNGNAIKIRTLMDKWDLLQTTNKELFDMSNKSAAGKLKRFGPFSIQERSEYLNYAPVMIAIMMNTKAKDPDGKDVGLWNAYDVNGKLKEGFTAANVDGKAFDEIKMVQKIKRTIEMNHGDYNNPLLIKATVGGRALSQFRTWMFEGFATRFETEKTDYALSYGMSKPYIKKGRYRSYNQAQLSITGATLGTMFIPGIGTAVGAAIGHFAGKYTSTVKSKNQGNAIDEVLKTLKHLGRKLIFSKQRHDDFNEDFSEVDAANMRKNMTELYLMITLTGVGLFLKALLSGDDEDEEFLITSFLLSQTTRLQTDIAFYTNPLEAEKLTKTAIPAVGIIADARTWFQDVVKLFDEDPKNDVFQSGTYKGKSKAWVHFSEMLPGSSQVSRLKRIEENVDRFILDD
tara:strand:+ start:7684 stop:11823 length:4140 start_codon:yes stop_codon:yes gene_type:complete